MSSRRLAPQHLGSLIGAAFGLVFVLVNSASSPTVVRAALVVVAVAATAAVLVGIARGPEPATPPSVRPFGRGYWAVVAAEVVAIVIGVRVVAAAGHPQAGVAWVATVVGIHFVVLAVLWRLRLFHVLGGALTALGVAGLALAFAGAPAVATDLTAGVGSGVVLLIFALLGVWGTGGTRRFGSARVL
ncbi:hypothetical protein [Rhodococcoides corynebacterioides]|uniref:DUF308 domain-containing protein n=1 Tax=Rhodococcoides corynebacterioides TaxID=53972 RepID=A0ABS7P4E9_9NOCA|nr:hypothetical protein [Rhodococcus corynebacterioides]MBY6367273.1 hypothetical protein [Rhodococcus corynebacterioides]MBY6408816.1 hypothetical protein [Rhodococcus corynebacterioides]